MLTLLIFRFILILKARMLGAIPLVQSVFLLRRDRRIPNTCELCHQWGDGCRQGYLRSWIHHDPHMISHSLLQARANLSITRNFQMRAPMTGDTISLPILYSWPWHCINWWGWGACTRCPYQSSYHCSILDSRMRLLCSCYLICRRSQLRQDHRPSCGNLLPSNHQQLLWILFKP